MKNSHMCDVHLLEMPEHNQEWKNQCLLQLKNEPINIYKSPGIKGDILQARNNGYALGNAPYVSFVDVDDLIEPGIFQKCIDILENNPTVVGCFTLSTIIDKDNNIIKPVMKPYREWHLKNMFSWLFEIHQLVVFRREFSNIVSEQLNNFGYQNHPYIEHLRYTLLGLQAPWFAMPDIGYHWRYNGNHGRKYINSTAQNTVEYIKLLKTLNSIS